LKDEAILPVNVDSDRLKRPPSDMIFCYCEGVASVGLSHTVRGYFTAPVDVLRMISVEELTLHFSIFYDYF
jgi:hypothetical protein